MQISSLSIKCISMTRACTDKKHLANREYSQISTCLSTWWMFWKWTTLLTRVLMKSIVDFWMVLPWKPRSTIIHYAGIDRFAKYWDLFVVKLFLFKITKHQRVTFNYVMFIIWVVHLTRMTWNPLSNVPVVRVRPLCAWRVGPRAVYFHWWVLEGIS